MIPKSVIDIDTRDAVVEMLAELGPFIQGSARTICRERSMAEDLAQEAAIKLWQIDPTRFDASEAEYLRAVLYKEMELAFRAERRQRGGKRRVEVGGL